MALFSYGRVVAILGGGAKQTESDRRAALVAQEEATGSLALVALLEVFFGQPGAIDSMIDDRLRGVADRNARLDEPAREIDVFRCPRYSGPEALIEAAGPVEPLARYEEICAVQRTNVF